MRAQQKEKLVTRREGLRKFRGSGHDSTLRLVQAPFGAVFWWIEQVIARRQDERSRRGWEKRHRNRDE
jgi:hypothetical protein